MIDVKAATAEDFPELGSTEAAVKSCVSLISGICGKPEAIMHYWLDLYYQVRLAYEKEITPALQLEIPRAELLQAVQTTQDEAGTESWAEQDAELQEGKGLPPDFEPVTQRKPGAQPGNTFAADSKNFKRETAQRLRAARQRGLRTVSDVTYVRGLYGGLPGTPESGVCYSCDIIIHQNIQPPYLVKKQYYKSNGSWSEVT